MTKMRKKLSASVNISELLAMREQGLTNYQIAERLGVTYRTIVSYIGKQPKGLRAPMGSRGIKPLMDAEPAKPEEATAEETPVLPERKSFSELLSEMQSRKAAEKFQEEHGIEADGETETALPGLVETDVNPAEVAREVHERLMADQVEKSQEADVTALIEEPAENAFVHELLAVFGRKAVRNYLKVALYVSGNVFITTPTHVDMLSVLRRMNAEVNVGD